MNVRSLLFIATLVVFVQEITHASPPSPQELDRWAEQEKQMKDAKKRAQPWKDALTKAFSAEPDSALRAEAAQLIWLTTYKHKAPAKAGAGPKKGDAEAFFKTWTTLKKNCADAGLKPLELMEAVYHFTNSDWAPVSATKGPGLDKVAAPEDYKRWADAAAKAGKKALAAGMQPSAAWSNQANSYKVREPKDIEAVGLSPEPVRF